MRITKDLKIAFSIESEAAGTVHVYSSPIARAVFEDYFSELGSAFTECFSQSKPERVVVAGPQIALPALRNAAINAGTWATAPGGRVGVKDGLVEEIKRLTTVSTAVAGKGWESLPLSTALARESLDEDDEAAILGVLVFFSAVCRAAPRKMAEALLPVVSSAHKWRLGSFTITEALGSSPTSTPAATGTKKPPSVIA